MIFNDYPKALRIPDSPGILHRRKYLAEASLRFQGLGWLNQLEGKQLK